MVWFKLYLRRIEDVTGIPYGLSHIKRYRFKFSPIHDVFWYYLPCTVWVYSLILSLSSPHRSLVYENKEWEKKDPYTFFQKLYLQPLWRTSFGRDRIGLPLCKNKWVFYCGGWRRQGPNGKSLKWLFFLGQFYVSCSLFLVFGIVLNFLIGFVYTIVQFNTN